jgi:hypothetical protein
MHRFAFIVVAASALVAAACADKTPPVLYPPLHLQEEFRIKNPSEAGLRTSILGAAVDRDSSIYLMEATRAELLVFDSSGKFLRTIGARGEEPGQFLMLGSTGIIGDTVWVSDPRQGRITLFSRAGKLIKTIDNTEELPLGGVDNRYSLLGILPDGSRLVGVTPGALEPDAKSDRSVPFMRVSPQNKVDTLFQLPIPGMFGVKTGANTRFVLRPFDERPIIGVRHDGAAWVEVERAAGESGPAAATVTRYSLERGREWSTKVPLNPVVVSREMSDSVIAAAAIDQAQQSDFRKWVNMPKRLPLVTSAMLSGDGTIWLCEASRADSSRWVRLDAQGKPNGQLVLPRGVLILFAGASRIWMLRKDGDAVSVVKYKVLS